MLCPLSLACLWKEFVYLTIAWLHVPRLPHKALRPPAVIVPIHFFSAHLALFVFHTSLCPASRSPYFPPTLHVAPASAAATTADAARLSLSLSPPSKASLHHKPLSQPTHP